MIEKQKNYEEFEVHTNQNSKKRFFRNRKTKKILFLEKHRILPGHEGGIYRKNNVFLLTFAEHTMAHYLRYLQSGKIEDQRAYKLMLSNSTDEIRREKANFAGQIGGQKQQESLRKQNLGWYNADEQRKRGLKGAKTARERRVGAFDPRNLMKANKAWQEKYDSDPVFREKNRRNLFVGNVQKFGIVVLYYDRFDNEIDSVRYNAPYISVSTRKHIEYTEARVHMSEDFFWYHVKFAARPSQSYKCYISNKRNDRLISERLKS
jgi:hypothetical protein